MAGREKTHTARMVYRSIEHAEFFVPIRRMVSSDKSLNLYLWAAVYVTQWPHGGFQVMVWRAYNKALLSDSFYAAL